MPLKSKTILILDDDSDILILLDKILKGAGMNVLIAESPQEARVLIEKHPPHIILTDLSMEGEDGFMFIESLKKQKSYEDIPILALSALNDFESVKKAIGLGINDYVIKPLNSAMLLRKLRKAISSIDVISLDLQKRNLSAGLEFSAKVTALGETGYELLAPLKIKSKTNFKITIKDFETLGVDSFHQEIDQKLGSYTSAGNFLNTFSFIAITDNAARDIRVFLKRNLQP
jgi:CheY-like chemotaxis protein